MGIDIKLKGSLSGAEVDSISEKIEQFLEKEDDDRQLRLRIRLSMEDMILKTYEFLGEGVPYTLMMGKNYGRRFIHFSYGGESFNPIVFSDDASENWSRRIMADLGLSPVWQYKDGLNVLELKFEKKRLGNLESIVLAMIAALAVGFLGMELLSEEIRDSLCELLFRPLQETFFKFLSVFSGFMILLSVACGIFNIGDASSFGLIGKNMFKRFIGITFAVATTVALVSMLLFPAASAENNAAGVDVSGLPDILNLIFDIIPGDPVSPFLNGNAMQVVVLGLIIGVTILILGEKMRTVRDVAQELNTLVMSILTAVCKFLPIYVFLVLTDMIWSDKFKILINIWKPFVAASVLSMLILLFLILYVSVKFKTSPVLLAKKMFVTFMICFSSATCITAFSQTIEDSRDKLGVDPEYVSVALPIRSILYKPALVTELVVLSFCMAQIYDVKISVIWIILTILTSSILTMACPPIPGAVAMLFGILFPELGIPVEAMAFAVTCDVFYDFIDAAVNNSLGMLEFVLQADHLDILDRDVLRKRT